MSVTYTYTGSLNLNAQAAVKFSGDQSGQQNLLENPVANFTAGTAPTISGFWTSVATVTTGGNSLLLAHATNPLNGFGTAVYSDGFTVASSKVKLILFENLDATNFVTIIMGAVNGFPDLFDAASHGSVLWPGCHLGKYIQTGQTALTSGTNDLITMTANTASVQVQVTVFYGT